MTQGDILKEQGLIVQKFTIKADTDITRGMLYYDDGAGLIVVTAALSALSKVVMATETHVYATDTTDGVPHTVPCVVKGHVIAAKVTSGGVVPILSKLVISATSGKVGIFAAGTGGGAGSASTYYTSAVAAAILTSELVNLEVIGYATAASADADTVQEMFLGAD